MSFSEENGIVKLTMSREDYDHVLRQLGRAAGAMLMRGVSADEVKRELLFIDRLNDGNPDYTPYCSPQKFPARSESSRKV